MAPRTKTKRSTTRQKTAVKKAKTPSGAVATPALAVRQSLRKQKSDPVYMAVGLQLTAHAVGRYPDRASARERMAETIEHIDEKVSGCRHWLGPALKLVVLPEYVLTSFPQGEPVAQWADKAALDMNGVEYERFGQIAQNNGLYLAGNAYEKDPNFPGFYFQTCFIVGPSGDVILRYRRLNSMFAPSPHDVWDKYLDIYGLEAVFPVVETEIGRLAPIASEEILYPEVARCFAMRGAEVFAHSSSEHASPVQTRKDAAKICRAVENIAYVVSANTAGIYGTDLPDNVSDGGSRIIDYRGKTLRVAGPGENVGASAEIDLGALRRERRKTGLNNTLIRQRFEAYAASYADHVFQPANSLLKKDGSLRKPDRTHFLSAQKATIRRLAKNGVI